MDAMTDSWLDGLVFLTHTAQPGGGELALARYLRHLAADRPQLLTLEPGPLWDQLADDGVEVRSIEGRSTAAVLGQFRRLLSTTRPRWIVANSMRAACFAALSRPSGTSLIYWVRDGLEASAMSRRNLTITRRITLPRTAGALANSHWTARTVRRVAPTLPVAVAPSPVGISGDLAPPAREDHGGPIRLLFLGRLSPWKGAHIAVRALERINDSLPVGAELTIAGGALFGEHRYVRRLQRLVAESPCAQRVSMLGHVADVESLLLTHDVLLHCSVVPEPFGQVIVQALAHGLPVVAAGSGGPAEIIQDGVTGLLYEPGSPSALAEAVVHLFTSESLLGQLRTAGPNVADRYRDDVCCERISTALQSLMRRPDRCEIR
jgi:glycosyltransferase involved in cell wall biosynthesis